MFRIYERKENMLCQKLFTNINIHYMVCLPLSNIVQMCITSYNILQSCLLVFVKVVRVVSVSYLFTVAAPATKYYF